MERLRVVDPYEVSWHQLRRTHREGYHAVTTHVVATAHNRNVCANTVAVAPYGCNIGVGFLQRERHINCRLCFALLESLLQPVSVEGQGENECHFRRRWAHAPIRMGMGGWVGVVVGVVGVVGVVVGELNLREREREREGGREREPFTYQQRW